jgi:hypothetical protein
MPGQLQDQLVEWRPVAMPILAPTYFNSKGQGGTPEVMDGWAYSVDVGEQSADVIQGPVQAAHLSSILTTTCSSRFKLRLADLT